MYRNGWNCKLQVEPAVGERYPDREWCQGIRLAVLLSVWAVSRRTLGFAILKTPIDALIVLTAATPSIVEGVVALRGSQRLPWGGPHCPLHA